MRYGILNSELGIVVVEGIADLGDIQVRLLEKQMPEGASLNDLALFYMYDRDWIVINKSHHLYEYYSQIVPIYLELSADSRKKAYSAAPTDNIKRCFDILDDIIRRRLFPLEAIRIYPCFMEHLPKPEKVEQKAQHYKETGLLQSPIILDSDNYLIDGFTSYLLAKQNNMECVPVRYGKRQIVRAYHKHGGRLYDWELPQKLIDRISAGDKVLVHTNCGVRFVTVAAVEPYRPQEHANTLRKVIRVKKEALHNDKL